MLLQKVFDSLNEAVFIVETGTRIILDVNRTVEDMFGYCRQEIIGASTSCLHVNEELSERFVSEMAAAYAANGIYETAFQMRRKDGSIFDSEHCVTPIRDEHGRIVSHVCVVRDVSERVKRSRDLEYLNEHLEERVRQAVEELSQSEHLRDNQNRLLVDLAPEAIIVFDVGLGTIVDANAKALKLFGSSPEELFATTPLSFLKDPQPDGLPAKRTFKENIERVLAGEVLTLERSLVNRAGARLTCEVHLVRMPSAKRLLVRATYIDVTERKKMADELARALAMAHKVNEEQRQFIGLISHELRTPLSIIDGAAQLLKLSACPDSDCLKLAQRIRSACTRLTSLMDTCLTEKRIASSGWEPDVRNEPLPEIVAEVAAACQKTTDKHVILADVKLLPKSYACDAVLMGVMLTNLLENAVKYSPNGGTIMIRGRAGDAGVVTLEVSDEGIGIAPEHTEKIFDRFYRAWQIADVPGAGLGLHLVRKIAELHGGDVRCASELGSGSTFTVTLSAPAASIPFLQSKSLSF